MKTTTFSFLACMLCFRLLGAQTDQQTKPPRLEDPEPAKICEVIGPKYKFKFDKGYDIISLQPIVRRNQIALFLGNSKGKTTAFLIRTVLQEDSKSYSEKFTLSSPAKVLKLEEHSSGGETLEYRGKKWGAYASYDKGPYVSLSEAGIPSSELARDISLMEESWEAALRLSYVRECLDYHKEGAQVAKILGGGCELVYCVVDNDLCPKLCVEWILDGHRPWDEFREPPFHEDWYPNDGDREPSDSGGPCRHRQGDCRGGNSDEPWPPNIDCGSGYESDGFGRSSSSLVSIATEEARNEALENARNRCTNVSNSGVSNVCCTKPCDIEGEVIYDSWICDAHAKACCSSAPPLEDLPPAY